MFCIKFVHFIPLLTSLLYTLFGMYIDIHTASVTLVQSFILIFMLQFLMDMDLLFCEPEKFSPICLTAIKIQLLQDISTTSVV